MSLVNTPTIVNTSIPHLLVQREAKTKVSTLIHIIFKTDVSIVREDKRIREEN
jgi:hypothetical protein